MLGWLLGAPAQVDEPSAERGGPGGPGGAAAAGAAGAQGGAGTAGLCARLCQLPQHLFAQPGGAAGGAGAFEEDERSGIARLVLPSGIRRLRGGQQQQQQQRQQQLLSSEDGAEGTMTPLRRREREEETNLNRYLLADQAGEGEAAGAGQAPGQARARAQAQAQAPTAGDSPSPHGFAAFQEMGGECCICTVNTATHYALPCRHAACKVCWSRWLSSPAAAGSPAAGDLREDQEQHKESCMTCANPVRSIRRFPESLVPLELVELPAGERHKHMVGVMVGGVGGGSAARAAGAEPGAAAQGRVGDDALWAQLRAETLALDQGLERCVRAVLLAKERLGGISEGLITVESHLIGIARPDPGAEITVDMLTSVLVVERSSVAEHLLAYQALFAEGQEWESLDLEVQALVASVRRTARLCDAAATARNRASAFAAAAVPSLPGGLARDVMDEQVSLRGDFLGDSSSSSSSFSSKPAAARAPAAGATGEAGKSSRAGAAKARADKDLRAALEAARAVAAPMAVAAQWERLKSLLATCGPSAHLVPGIVRVFRLIQLPPIPGAANDTSDIPCLAQRTLAQAAQRSAATDAAVTRELLPASAALLRRLEAVAGN
jgi:hypothetical protein